MKRRLRIEWILWASLVGICALVAYGILTTEPGRAPRDADWNGVALQRVTVEDASCVVARTGSGVALSCDWSPSG